MKWSENGKKLITGIALIALSIVVIAAGIAVSRSSHSQMLFILFSIPAAIMIVTGGAMAGPPLISGDARLLLTGSERTITAEVLGVTRNLRTKGEKVQYYVVCRYRDPVTGREETYTSEALDAYPGREIIGRQVAVRIDPGERGKYTVELEPLMKELASEKRAASQIKEETVPGQGEEQAAGEQDTEQTKVETPGND